MDLPLTWASSTVNMMTYTVSSKPSDSKPPSLDYTTSLHNYILETLTLASCLVICSGSLQTNTTHILSGLHSFGMKIIWHLTSITPPLVVSYWSFKGWFHPANRFFWSKLPFCIFCAWSATQSQLLMITKWNVFAGYTSPIALFAKLNFNVMPDFQGLVNLLLFLELISFK